MPQRSVYIREEDDEQWLALQNKSEFIHNALNSKKPQQMIKDIPTEQKANKPKDAQGGKNFCEHGQLRGECLWKGCKYAK